MSVFPDPNHINCILEILINVTRLYAQTDMSKAQSIENYITQITPQLFSLYDQSVNQMLTHTQSTFCSPKDTYIPHTNGILQKFLDELKLMKISVDKRKEEEKKKTTFKTLKKRGKIILVWHSHQTLFELPLSTYIPSIGYLCNKH